MSLFDKFLDVMRLNPDDDEFYNEDYEYEEDDYEDEKAEKAASASRRDRNRQQRAERSERTNTSSDKTQKQSGKITPIAPISRNKKQGSVSGMEVCVIRPNSIEDELEITDTLLNGRTVVINMEGLSVDIAQRIIDFTSGSTYAMRGNLQKISNYIFLATPSGVDISGDIQNLMEAFEVPGFSL